MLRSRRLLLAGLAFLLLSPHTSALAEDAPQAHAQKSASSQPAQPLPADATTHHTLGIAGEEIAYTAVAGTLPLTDDKGDKAAEIFYTAFLRENVEASGRPITYAFNGGPGAASAYLDIGALGPRALDFGASGKPLPAVDRVNDNPDSWLSFTDLVFIDPVGTGYSRALGGEESARKLWSVRPDLDALARIIRLHLTRSGRLASPVYLVGESYGGFRAARLSQQLARDEGIAVRGVMLVSPVLEFRLMSGDEFDLLPWALHLPAYAAVALEAKGALSPEALAPAEHFALGDYLTGLAAGNGDTEATRHLYAGIAELIGVDEKLVERWHGRIPTGAYVKEMGRAKGEVLSRYDGSVAGLDPDPRSDRAEDDPVLDGSIAPFTRAFLAYCRDELGFKTDRTYELLNGEVGQHWNWQDGHTSGRNALGAADALRRALALHPKMHVLIAHGLTDLTTPYMMSRYVVDHLPSRLTQSRIELKLYAGGHMMYLRSASRHRLREDAAAFYGAQ